jgi:hypothetical protein
MNNSYLIVGKRRLVGAIGIPEEFEIEKDAPSSREAYITIRDESYDGGYETVLVTAIKMKCPEHGTFHITVDPNLYLI